MGLNGVNLNQVKDFGKIRWRWRGCMVYNSLLERAGVERLAHGPL